MGSGGVKSSTAGAALKDVGVLGSETGGADDGMGGFGLGFEVDEDEPAEVL